MVGHVLMVLKWHRDRDSQTRFLNAISDFMLVPLGCKNSSSHFQFSIQILDSRIGLSRDLVEIRSSSEMQHDRQEL